MKQIDAPCKYGGGCFLFVRLGLGLPHWRIGKYPSAFFMSIKLQVKNIIFICCYLSLTKYY